MHRVGTYIRGIKLRNNPSRSIDWLGPKSLAPLIDLIAWFSFHPALKDSRFSYKLKQLLDWLLAETTNIKH